MLLTLLQSNAELLLANDGRLLVGLKLRMVKPSRPAASHQKQITSDGATAAHLRVGSDALLLLLLLWHA